MENILENYPGSKSGSGIIQWLINNTPLHTRYFELFAGSAQLYRAKRPAAINIVSDINPSVFDALRQKLKEQHGCLVLCNKSALSVFKEYDHQIFWGSLHSYGFSKDDFIYLDPPYPESARRSGKAYYKYEMLSDSDHAELLTAIRDVPANVMISTRQNDLYDIMLSDWRKETFQTADRAGVCEEVIYMNYDSPVLLHQYDYVGLGFTDRQRVRRKISRFSDKLEQLPTYEKHLFIQELIKNDPTAVKHFLAMASIEK